MKKMSTLLLFSLFYLVSTAQHCNFVSNSATPAVGLPVGFYPEAAALPCAINGQATIDTLYFKTFPAFSGFNVNSWKFDSIGNLPTGLCWSTNKATNTFAGGEDGVILIQGTTSAAAGQYKLKIIVTFNLQTIGNINQQDLETLADIRYYMRVACGNGGCNDIDTVMGKINSFIPDTVCTGNLYASITPSGPTSICSGTSLTLFANPGANYTYRWSTGETTRIITPTSTNSYTVTVYNTTDSAVSAPISVTINQSPYAHFYMQPDTAPHVWHVMNQCYGSNLSYTWDWGDGSYDYTDTATHEFADSGYYTICVSVQDQAGCYDSYCDTNVYLYKTANQMITADIVRAPNTGVNDVQTKVLDIKYYGNAIHFAEPIKNASAIKLYDLSGRVVMEKERFTGSSIDLNTDLAHGVYVLRVENDHDLITKKILIAQ